MTYVITDLCIDVKDQACMEECPVDCIFIGERMLIIHPDECVTCGACEPVCPVEAIFYDDDVPSGLANAFDYGYELAATYGSPGGAQQLGVLPIGPRTEAEPVDFVFKPFPSSPHSMPSGSITAVGFRRPADPSWLAGLALFYDRILLIDDGVTQSRADPLVDAGFLTYVSAETWLGLAAAPLLDIWLRLLDGRLHTMGGAWSSTGSHVFTRLREYARSRGMAIGLGTNELYTAGTVLGLFPHVIVQLATRAGAQLEVVTAQADVARWACLASPERSAVWEWETVLPDCGSAPLADLLALREEHGAQFRGHAELLRAGLQETSDQPDRWAEWRDRIAESAYEIRRRTRALDRGGNRHWRMGAVRATDTADPGPAALASTFDFAPELLALSLSPVDRAAWQR